MYRQIIGNVARTDDTPYQNIKVIFYRDTGSFTSTTHYPPDICKCDVDEDGKIVGCKLWVNETGEKISYYTGVIGKDRFKFSIPAGDGSPIELSVLRAGSNPVETYPQSIIDYIDTKFSQSGNDSIKFNFSDTNLVAGKLLFSHNLNNTPIIEVLDQNKNKILPKNINHISLNTTEIDLSSFVVSGNWLAIAR